MYTRVDETGWTQSNLFKKAFSVDVPIEFVGVWYVLNDPLSITTSADQRRCRDTVNSVGLIPRRLPFTTSNTIVHTFRHAVSLDERRAKFKANLWNRPTANEASLGVTGQKPQVPVLVSGSGANGAPKPKKERENSLRAMERKYNGIEEKPTDIEEVGLSLIVSNYSGSLTHLPPRFGFRDAIAVRPVSF